MEKIVREKQLSRNRCQDLYNLVLDVDQYQYFIPWCRKSKVTKKVGDDLLYADLWIGKEFFQRKFTSKIIHNRSNYSISTSCKDGPFGSLKSNWKFTKLQDAEIKDLKQLNIDSVTETNKKFSIIDFYLSFHLKSSAISILGTSFYSYMFTRMISSFKNRAASLYKVEDTK